MEDLENQDLAQWLDTRFLGSYATILASNGYTSVLDISSCSEDDLPSIIRLFKKPGHRLKARLLLEDLRAAAKGFKPASLGLGASGNPDLNMSMGGKQRAYDDADENDVKADDNIDVEKEKGTGTPLAESDDENAHVEHSGAIAMSPSQGSQYESPVERASNYSDNEAPPADSSSQRQDSGMVQVDPDMDEDEIRGPVQHARKSVAPVLEESDPEDENAPDDQWEEKDLIVVPTVTSKKSVHSKVATRAIVEEEEEPDQIVGLDGQTEEAVEEPPMAAAAAPAADELEEEEEEIVVVHPAAGKKPVQEEKALDATDEIVVPVGTRITAAPKPKAGVVAVLDQTSSPMAAPQPAGPPPTETPAPTGKPAPGAGNKAKAWEERMAAEKAAEKPKPAVAPKPIGKIAIKPNVPMPMMMGKMPSVVDVRQSNFTNSSASVPADPDEDDQSVEDAPKPDKEKLKSVLAGGFQPGMPRGMMHPKAAVQPHDAPGDQKAEEELLPCDDEDASALKKIDAKNIKNIVRDGTVDFMWNKNGNPYGGQKRSVFLLLDETTIYWFKAKTDATPAGKISLARQGLVIDNPEETEYITITAGVDVFTITFRSEAERDEWSKTMKKTKIMMRSTPIANPTNSPAPAAAAAAVSNAGQGGAGGAKQIKKQVSAAPTPAPSQPPKGGDDDGDEEPGEDVKDPDDDNNGGGASDEPRPTTGGMTERDVEKLLIDGQVFMKYKHGRAKKRHIWAPPEMDKLYWGGSDDKSKAKGYILIKDIAEVVEGCKGAKKQNLAFTITTADRSLELEAPNSQVKTRWMDGIRVLLNNKPKKSKK
jgi:hypothetical protein